MKIYPFNKIVILIIIVLSLFACQSEVPNESDSLACKASDNIENQTLDLSKLNPTAKKYYDLLARIFLSTGLAKVHTRQGNDVTGIENGVIDETELLDWQEKLNEIEICDENGHQYKFTDLNDSVQVQFIESWTIEDALILSEKMEYEPNLEDIINAENQVIESLLNEYETDVKNTRSVVKVNCTKQFFKTLSAQLTEINQNNNRKENCTRSSTSAGISRDSTVVIDKINRCARTGDILFAKENVPRSFICTTLVWYCYKFFYNIDISPWGMFFITPASIFRSNNVYVRGIIN